jgi:WD40 repeat protein
MQHQGHVYAVAFSPDGKTVLTASGQWLFIWERQSDAITSARFFQGGWTGWTRGLHFLDPSGHRLEVALLDTGNSVVIRTIDFDRPDSMPIQGDAKSLLSQWMGKVALKFDERGRIVPLYPVSTPQRPEDGGPRR